ncbi:uncharacterized protein LOC106940704 [Poecilia latipinna]|uniref:uncharacterized protein LOC106940704 n=1 Tax=Poecilia latipinna TaxID=48699 RepID=UPI00072E1899|nr:PREDICTED: uncharacterized protein LOC106940704 [Poecilia latipinna]
MSPAPRLVVLLLAARIAASQTFTDAGKDFRVIFPENIAYYYPSDAHNKIWVTALHNDTSVTMSSASSETKLNAGHTKSFDVTQELGRLTINDSNDFDPFTVFSISDKTVHITSTKDIVIQAVSSRGRSVQSALVIPTTKLSNKYFIPPVPETEGTTSGGAPVVNVTERAPFRLIIVNPDEPKASVTIKGRDEIPISIESGKAAQIWVDNGNTTQYVEANKRVAVYFSHPCAVQHQCTCGLLHAMVPPAKNDTMKFPIPPVLGKPASILLSDEANGRWINSSSLIVESAGTAIVYWPSLLLTLVPVEEFGSCFVVQFIEGKENILIIVVHKDHKQGIHIGNDPLGGAGWQELEGTDYVSTNRSISSTTVVWHMSANMTVYHMAQHNNTWFGNPAPVVSANPDFRGCILTPEVTMILHEAESWQESIQSCQKQSLNLISLSSEALQKHTCQNLRGNDAKQVWIGTRRRSLTGDWYWLNSNGFNDTNWARSEPGDVSEGQCAVMSLEGDCGWKDRNCCEAARPLCYAAPQVLQIN